MKKTIFKQFQSNEIEGAQFIKDIYDHAGIFILRNIIPDQIIRNIQEIWTNYITHLRASKGRTIDKNNFVNFKDELPAELLNFWKSEIIKQVANDVFGPNVALYNNRIVLKDKRAQNKVFLHQDFCYHVGCNNKCSLFIPLFKCGKEEGGLSFYPGSHNYGYLGDAGEIDKSKFQFIEPLTPTLFPGDIAIMNSSVWHESGENNTDTDRVLFDIIIQPSNDPSGIELLSGEWMTEYRIDRSDPTFEIASMFKSCRSKKLKELTNK